MESGKSLQHDLIVDCMDFAPLIFRKNDRSLSTKQAYKLLKKFHSTISDKEGKTTDYESISETFAKVEVVLAELKRCKEEVENLSPDIPAASQDVCAGKRKLVVKSDVKRKKPKN